jgi:UDP-N-acetylglucosamine 2-epimerase (non-hydrolysing)
MMKNIPNICLTDPISYVDLISLLKESSLILSDSGGIQEESFVLEKRIIILRKETERPEVVESGYGVLAGHNKDVICAYFDEIIEGGQTFSRKGCSKEIYGEPGISKNILEKIKNSRY